MMLEPGTAGDMREWQQAVVAELRVVTQTQSATTLALQRITDRLDGMDAWRKERDQMPTSLREWSGFGVTLAMLAISGLCGGAALVVSVVNLVSSHWH